MTRHRKPVAQRLAIMALGITLASCGLGLKLGGKPPAIAVTAISPSSGSFKGDFLVTVTGSGFSGGAPAVTLGGASCQGVSVISDTTLTCTAMGVTAPQAADVQVSMAGKTAGLLRHGLFYETFGFQYGSLGWDIFAFAQNPLTGALRFINSYSDGSNEGSYGSTVDPAGKFFYFLELFYGIRTFAINSVTGALTLGTQASVTGTLNFMGGSYLTPNGNFIFAPNPGATTGTDYGLFAYQINRSTGVLTAAGGGLCLQVLR